MKELNIHNDFFDEFDDITTAVDSSIIEPTDVKTPDEIRETAEYKIYAYIDYQNETNNATIVSFFNSLYDTYQELFVEYYIDSKFNDKRASYYESSNYYIYYTLKEHINLNLLYNFIMSFLMFFCNINSLATQHKSNFSIRKQGNSKTCTFYFFPIIRHDIEVDLLNYYISVFFFATGKFKDYSSRFMNKLIKSIQPKATMIKGIYERFQKSNVQTLYAYIPLVLSAGKDYYIDVVLKYLDIYMTDNPDNSVSYIPTYDRFGYDAADFKEALSSKSIQSIAEDEEYISRYTVSFHLKPFYVTQLLKDSKAKVRFPAIALEFKRK